jgi:hypothetical protein
MTITINSDRINIGETVIHTTPTGIHIVNGGFRAQELTPTVSSGAQGISYGYMTGGRTGVPGLSVQADLEKIERFPLVSDGNTASVGALARGGIAMFAASSMVSGYASGGYAGPPYYTQPPENRRKDMNKFPFASNANATFVSNLAQYKSDGASAMSEYSGYIIGGTNGNSQQSAIEKYPFSTDSGSTSVATISRNSTGLVGMSSATYGYTAGGGQAPQTIIEKVAFATDANSTTVGYLTTGKYAGAGQNSNLSGYFTAGGASGTPQNVIEKWPFTTDVNATNIGNLTLSRRGGPNGISSTTSGYTAGGYAPASFSSVIDKFPFSADTNAVSVGSLLGAKGWFAGTGQVN